MPSILANIDFAVTPLNTAEVDVTGMKFIQAIVDRVVHAASVIRVLQFSVNGGASWFGTAGDYIDVPSNGTPGNLAAMGFHFTASLGPNSGSMSIWQPGGSILPQIYSQANSDIYMFAGSALPINRIRLMGGSVSVGTPTAGNMTSGRFQVWGER